MVRIGNAVYYSHGSTSHHGERSSMEVFAQLMAVFTLTERLPAEWVAFIDNTAGEAALKKGYGKDRFVNVMLSTFWATAARRGWPHIFARLESKNVADAVSRADLSRAVREGWQRLDIHPEQIVNVLARAVSDAQFAPEDAVDELFCLSVL